MQDLSLFSLNHLEIATLSRLGRTSKTWKAEADIAIGKKIVAIRVFPENPLTQRFQDGAIHHLNALIPTKFKFEAENWLSLVNTVTMLKAAQPDYEKIVENALHLCSLRGVNPLIASQARTISAKMLAKGHANLLPPGFGIPKETDDEEVLAVQNYFAELHLNKQISYITDDQVSFLLQKVIENKNGTEVIHLHAAYLKALLTFQDRDKNSTYPIAFATFQKVKETTLLNRAIRRNADCHQTFMQAKGLVYTDDYTQIAEKLFEIGHDQKSTIHLKTHALFYLAELTLAQLTTRIGVDTAEKIVRNVSNNKDFSKELLPTFVNHRSDSESFVEKHSPKLESLKDGGLIQVKGKTYTAITSHSRQFSEQPIAFCRTGKEIILHDPENSQLAGFHFQNVLKAISFAKVTEEQILYITLNYIRKNIFSYSHDSFNVDTFVYEKKLNDPTTPLSISIDEFITRKMGDCWHQTLVTTYILDRLTKEISPKTKKPYLTGVVQIMQSDGHIWASISDQTRITHVDTLKNTLVYKLDGGLT